MPGAVDVNGVYQYAESDLSSPLSTTLNLGQAAQSAVVAALKSHPSGRWGLAVAGSAVTGTFPLLAASAAFASEVDAGKFTNAGGAVTVNDAGWYDIHLHMVWQSNAAGRRVAMLVKNGTITGSSVTAGGAMLASCGVMGLTGGETFMDLRSRPVLLAAGDVIRAYTFQDSGSTLTLPIGTPLTYLGETSLLIRKKAS